MNFASNGGTDNVGIHIDIDFDNVAASDEGYLNEGNTVGFALDELSVGSTGVAAKGGGTTLTASGLNEIDTMLDNLSRMRSYVGAVQNSLESKAEYVGVAMENAAASRSRVKDVDVAKESSVMLKNQILQQSSAAMLSQANQTPQLALNLLP